MTEDAFNTLQQLITLYKEITSIDIDDRGKIFITFHKEKDIFESCQEFTNSTDILEWLENNLTKVK